MPHNKGCRDTHARPRHLCSMCEGEVGGQGMAKLFSKARQGISGLAEVNSISLKCDLCDYETKSCRKSRAKKQMTSHCEKHHREDKDVSKNVHHVEFESHEACHIGRDSREVFHDVVEKSLQGDTVEDSLCAGEDTGQEVHHVGGEDGPEVQCVPGEGQEAGEHCDGVKKGPQGEAAA